MCFYFILRKSEFTLNVSCLGDAFILDRANTFVRKLRAPIAVANKYKIRTNTLLHTQTAYNINLFILYTKTLSMGQQHHQISPSMNTAHWPINFPSLSDNVIISSIFLHSSLPDTRFSLSLLLWYKNVREGKSFKFFFLQCTFEYMDSELFYFITFMSSLSFSFPFYSLFFNEKAMKKYLSILSPSSFFSHTVDITHLLS